jgi:2-haloacid dehalogenase
MAPPPPDFERFEVLTFDCYGTLIDWETGILRALRTVLGEGGPATDDALLEAYAGHEMRLEGGPWHTYRAVLEQALSAVCLHFGVQPTPEQAEAFGSSLADWPPFADSAAALALLARHFELAVITNCDDDLFALSDAMLGEPFRWIITAEQAHAYKPARSIFELALARIGRPPERILHVAQSLFHDHVPARQLGLATAWVNRRRDRAGFGATPPAAATPDLIVPDIASLAEMALAGRASTTSIVDR